jgi:long-chain fatty acid transport protein
MRSIVGAKQCSSTLLVLAFLCSVAFGQGYGPDMHNVLGPASGGMAGVSFAQPQDVPSAIFGNPSAMAQFLGTQFTLGTAWVEPIVRLEHDGAVTGTAFSDTSGTEGFLNPTVGVTQGLDQLGVPVTIGIGFGGLSGAGAEFRGDPASLGTTSELLIYGLNVGAGARLTDRLSVGAALTLGMAIGESGLAESSAMSHAYGLRGTLGLDYEVMPSTMLGAFYQTKMSFTLDDAVLASPPGTTPPIYQNLPFDEPDNIGLGIANHSLMNGDLLIAVDILFKEWDNATFWQNVYDNQWAYAVGAQLTRGKMKYRLGYSYSDNPIRPNPIGTSPEAVLQYIQGAELAAIWKHRLTGGVGLTDVLPGLDLDLFAGGLFPETDQFGAHTTATVAVWYTGIGLTWRFGTNGNKIETSSTDSDGAGWYEPKADSQ